MYTHGNYGQVYTFCFSRMWLGHSNVWSVGEHKGSREINSQRRRICTVGGYVFYY